MSDIPNERLREIVDKTYCLLDEGESMARELLAARAEVERLRVRVGWLDHLDTPEGRSMHATEAVLVENEQLRADLLDALDLLDNLEIGHQEWLSRWRQLREKHKGTP